MSDRFRTGDTTAVSLPDEPNEIRIKKRIDLRGQTLLEQTMIPGGRAADESIIGALMVAYIAGWSGPDFDGLPCTPENVLALPFDDPLVEKVHNEIAERYREYIERKQQAGNAVSSVGSKS